jgi:hypothetical protein
MLDATFISAILEGIEGTLEELIGRVPPGALRSRLSTLHADTVAARRVFEEEAGGDAAAGRADHLAGRTLSGRDP